MKHLLSFAVLSLLAAGCTEVHQNTDLVITLPAKTAEVHGKMLRYEPEPHKNTLGYWTEVTDWASWNFVAPAGTYAVEVLQGCGKGQGGSEVQVVVGGQNLSFIVEDTGHFQNFVPRIIGRVTFEQPAEQTIAVKPIRKAAAAVMDLRQIRLLPADKTGKVVPR